MKRGQAVSNCRVGVLPDLPQYFPWHPQCRSRLDRDGTQLRPDLLVTHDVQEAVALADRVILIEDGRIALDENIALARPRWHGDAEFARIEKRILHRLLQKQELPKATRQARDPGLPEITALVG